MFSLRHVGVTVTDMDSALRLYQQYFKFEVVWDQIEEGPFIDGLSAIPNIKVRTVKMKDKSSPVMLELLQYISHPKNNEENKKNAITNIGCSHFAITVKDLEKTFTDLSSMGLIFNKKPCISPDGNAKVAFCRDFDGTLLELVEQIS